ncbi:MAG TPA: NINE protein [Eoetvoesiella sp.]
MTTQHTGTSTTAPAATRTERKSKTIAALLAAVLGVFGAHWWYLGRRYAWLATALPCVLIVLTRLYPVWWDSPPFLLLIIPATAGYIEALILALKPDAQFDARYNPLSGVATQTGWGPVVIAIFTTLLGSSVLVFGIALIVMHVYTAMGWLDGYVF